MAVSTVKLEIVFMNKFAPTISLLIRMIAPLSFSPGTLLTNHYQPTKSEATSCYCYRDIFITIVLCPNSQRAITWKMQRAITKENTQ